MFNLNGTISSTSQALSIENRGFRYGDSLFETIKVHQGHILFWEDHYFRLMASMRILRMEIPMHFTMEFMEEQILNTLKANDLLEKTARVRLYVYRREGGLYQPKDRNVDYLILADQLDNVSYKFMATSYEVDLFKDYFVAPGLLSTLKTNNRILNVVGSVYAEENELDNCLLLNTNKQVIEALNGNLFVLKGKELKTPPLVDGCLNGVMRKQIMSLAKKLDGVEVVEASISPFELQKADEMFISNTIAGMVPITKYRKKTYSVDYAGELLKKLNEEIQSN